jgi:hypothetical protein
VLEVHRKNSTASFDFVKTILRPGWSGCSFPKGGAGAGVRRVAVVGSAPDRTSVGRPTHACLARCRPSGMSLAIVLGAGIVLQIVWRLILGHQMPPAVSGVKELASKAVHYLLYAMLATQAALGFVRRWSGNEATSLFGLMTRRLSRHSPSQRIR